MIEYRCIHKKDAAPLAARNRRKAIHKASLPSCLQNRKYTVKNVAMATAVENSMPLVAVSPIKTPSNTKADIPAAGIR